MKLARSANCLAKLDRMNKTLRHEEADRIPISDFYWTTFVNRWRKELGLAADADIYRHYDLDWICINPNMDPHIKPFTVIKETEEDVILKTGFEATIRKKLGTQMPYFESFDTDDLDKMAAFRFDDPWDDRRYFSGGDDQINGVGDVISRNLPSFIERVKSYYEDFPVFGSICEGHEYLWRVIGSENVLLWLALYPDELHAFVERVGSFVVELTKAQIKAADGMLAGMVVWGDVAYRNGMLFSPEMWRLHFKPITAELIRVCHDAGLPVIYHGCGNASEIYDDFIEIGLDSYNPLEAKSGLDVVDLRKKHGHKMGFCGNIDALAWANDPLPDLEAQVMRKLNAAKGGGYLPQSDHSVPSNVSAERYEFVLNLLRKHAAYPLDLGKWDDPSIPGGRK
ncbi:MAG TPA: uroporphyrinogen decarboxylase family protein [Rectinemataceae bacterium]|nr:uroporphyrinogen decarboxylase family protein [Rectinemataceae bacterium]